MEKLPALDTEEGRALGQVGTRLRRESQRETDDILPGIKWKQGHRTFRALFSLGS